MKKALSILLSLVLVIAALPLAAVESSATDYYTTPDGLWKYYIDPSDNVVIYSGSTSTAYLGTETDIVVPSVIDGRNVVSLGQYALSGNITMESIVIPNTVNTLANNVFQNCSNLKTVTMSNNIGGIGPYAFYNCVSLESITLPNSCTVISNNAFQGCAALESINIPLTVTTLGSAAFYGCTSLQSITIPGSVTSVGSEVFRNCTSLESAVLCEGVEAIGSYMFTGCTSLASITMPDSLKTIGYEALWNCKSLENLVIGSHVTNIDTWAFEGCSNLKSITFPATLKKIEGNAFSGCGSLNAIYISDLAAWCSVTFNSYPLDAAHNLYLNGQLVTDLVIPGTVTEVKKGAFSGCTSITSLTIQNGVTTIGNDAFRNCTNLETVSIPASLTTVTTNAFQSDTALTGVYITDLESWCAISFSNENSNPLFNAHKLYINNSLGTVTVPNTVSEIKPYVFAGVENDIVIPNSVTTIGRYAFFNSITPTISLGNGIQTIGDWAFGGNTVIQSVNLCDGITSLGYAAFYGCSSLQSITIPGSVTSIGSEIFRNCTSLESAVLCEGVESISGYMFTGCTSLASVTMPDSLKTVGYEAFWNCKAITSLKVGRNVTRIDSWAFEGCSNMRSIIIPSTVTSIAGNSFSGCSVSNYYCFIGTTGDTYWSNSATKHYIGDMDSDGTIDNNDIGAVISASAGNLNMTEVQEIVADYNLDGAIDGFDAAEVDRYVYSINTAKGDVNQDGNTDLADYAMTKAHISGVAVDNNTPANLLDKSYLTSEYDSIKDNYPNGTIITQQYYCADYDCDKAVDAFDLFYLDKRINNLI